jgi:hypothetical protein
VPLARNSALLGIGQSDTVDALLQQPIALCFTSIDRLSNNRELRVPRNIKSNRQKAKGEGKRKRDRTLQLLDLSSFSEKDFIGFSLWIARVSAVLVAVVRSP